MMDSLEERENQLRSFYDLNLVGLAIISPDKGWIRVNDYLCRMLEYPEQELREMSCGNYIDLIWPPTLRNTHCYWRNKVVSLKESD